MADVSGEQLHFGQALLYGADGFHHARGVAVGGVDGEHVDFLARQFHGALEKIAGGADGRAHAQAALLVLRGVGKFQLFLDVLDGDQALEVEVLVHDEKLFDAVALQDALGFFERGADGHGDQIVLGHHRADGLIEIALEAQIAVGENADEALARA